MLRRYFLLVQLPILIHRYRWCTVDQSFHVRKEGLAAFSDLPPDVFATIRSIILILLLSDAFFFFRVTVSP